MTTLEVLKDIKKDMKRDIEELDKKPFNGKNVAEMFGKQAAAVTALAHIIELFLTSIDELEKGNKK